MRLSQQITIIRDKTSLPINAGMRFPRIREEKTTGILALALGIIAILPVLLVMFI